MAVFLKWLRSLKQSRMLLAGLALVLLLGAGGLAYAFYLRQAAVEAGEPALQTATVQQGDLVISASGTGVLGVAEEIELEFESAGQVTGVYVKPGDLVEKGTLLAEIDDENARIKYEQAKQEYLELTSDAAIAAAQKQVAQAQTDLDSAWYDLEYLISPQVVYWERQVEEAKQARKQAKAALEANPSSQDARDALEKAKAYLDFAEDKLAEAWDLYYEEYIPETFRIVKEVGEKDIYDAPTDLHILLARTAIEEAQKKLAESQEYYNVLMGGEMPENASNNALLALQDARRNLEDAQADLDGTKIFAPVAGTILSVDLAIGHMVDMDRNTDAVTGTVITMADLSRPVLEIYLDETDWELVAIGSPVEIVFDTLQDKTFTGKVSQMDEELYQSDNASVVKAKVQLDSGMDEINLPIGSSAIVDVIYARVEDAVLIPVEALHETSPGEYTVFVVEDGELKQRVVEIGLQGQLYVEVKSGLQAGEVVSIGLATTN